MVCVVILGWLIPCLAAGQTAQKGAEIRAEKTAKLRIDYIGYRAARCETEKVIEPENERPNRGGLVHVYFTNVSDQHVQLAYWRANGEDESYWRLGGFLAWDRVYDKGLEPGQMTVLEINALTDHFGKGAPFSFSWIDRTWRPAVFFRSELGEDPVQISYIRVLPGMNAIDVHVRHAGKGAVELSSLEVVGREVKQVRWVGKRMAGPARAIARVELRQPLSPSQLVIVKLGVQSNGEKRDVYAHRRAFEDWFPIGCWSSNPETYEVLRRLHIETVVRGGTAGDEFYSVMAPKYGFRTLVPTEGPGAIDTVRRLGDHPAVACWMLADEPDWGVQADVMLFVDGMIRQFDLRKPTFITLCRNVKFFEYASICDIPCMDHYCVAAPSSSKWPKRYGTRLEETAYYTRDLKAASEPKPIWVWSQAIANWDGRPKRPVPTPNELAAQLLLNLGRGAKGILWFNYDHDVAEQYPDTREAMRRWGRVLRLVRDDLLAAEPYETNTKAPDKVDVAALLTWDKVLIVVTNVDYEIHDEAYPFATKDEVHVAVDVPEWIEPAAALRIDPDGVSPLPFKASGRRVRLDLGRLEVGGLIVLATDPGAHNAYADRYQTVLQDELRAF